MELRYSALASAPHLKSAIRIEPTGFKVIHPAKSKAGRRLVIFALLVAAFIAVVMLYRPRIPTHAGKDVYYWMFQTSSSDLKENPGLSALGTNAVPPLATALRVRRTEFDRYTWLQ